MRSSVRYALFGIIAVCLGACARGGPPAPVVMGSGAASSSAARAAVANDPIAPGSNYVVRAGDTIFTISRRSGVPTRTLIDANRLAPPYALEAGTRLAIPAVRTHEVRPGDTASQIAQRYGVPLRELVRVNSIEPPYVIRVGQRLAIPETAQAAHTAPAIVAANEPPSRVTAVPRTSVEAAPLPAPVVPVPSGAVQPVSPPPAVPVASVPPQTAAVPPPPTAIAPPPAANPPASPPDATLAVPTAAGRMLWPVRGVVVSEYGPKPGGLQNDGINIAAPRGTAFRAAEGGVVIYAGNELRGFGNLLLVRHDSGYVTAYAHADELAVQRGEQVRRGQTIGRVGSSGNVTSPQLHFEVRRGTRAVNPADFLGAQTGDSN
ncbi:MAG: peptidoglycan DD-metalloendopeptidase family protein [Proteobacteria bacterium]|nr:peptidoglycan DD-metalloendopeptidase family protein [Pseudomonadota bacterium]